MNWRNFTSPWSCYWTRHPRLRRTHFSLGWRPGLGVVGGEGEAGRRALGDRVEGVAREVGELGIRVEDWAAAVSDSLVAAEGRILDEQGQRRYGDRRNAIQAGIAAGLLLIGVGVVWWYGRSRAATLDGRIGRIQPDVADRIEKGAR